MCARCIGGYEGRLSPGQTDVLASRPVRHRAPPRPDLLLICPGSAFDKFSQACLATNRRRYTSQQPGTSTAGIVLPSVYLRCALFVLPDSCRQSLFLTPGESKGGCILGEPTCRRPLLPRPDRPVFCAVLDFTIIF